MGDAHSRDHAGGDITSIHNDLREMGNILTLFTTTLTGWQERQEKERMERQRWNDDRMRMIENGIEGLRDQVNAVRVSLRWLRWLTIAAVCVLALIVIRLWPALTVLALAR
jgi:Flp pilus assembly protein TadB